MTCPKSYNQHTVVESRFKFLICLRALVFLGVHGDSQGVQKRPAPHTAVQALRTTLSVRPRGCSFLSEREEQLGEQQGCS